MQNLPEYEEKKLTSITKEGLKFGDEEADDKKREDIYKGLFKPLTTFMKDLYGTKVEKVSISSRLETTPAMLVTSQFGYSANMERIMKSQAFSDKDKAQVRSFCVRF